LRTLCAVEVRARDMSHRIDHRHDHQPEGDRDLKGFKITVRLEIAYFRLYQGFEVVSGCLVASRRASLASRPPK
jgi:hypothetical protein